MFHNFFLYSLGSDIFPFIADAATVAGEARYINELGLPILPLKFLFAVDIATSPSARTPLCVPTHGPHPGAYEKSLGAARTDELAVMLDTFQPLALTAAALSLDDPGYTASFVD